MLILSPSITNSAQLAEDVRNLWPELSACLLCDASEDPHGPPADGESTVIDYLQVPENSAELFCSAVRFLRHRLARNIEPLVMAFDRSVLEQRGSGGGPAANMPVRAGFAPGDRLAWLEIDEITASGPLLPVFAATIRTEGLSDRDFADLLSASFDG